MYGDEYAAAESNDEIVDKTIPQSPIKNRTWSKSRKLNVPEALMCSGSEDELPHSQPRQRIHASPAPLRAVGHAIYFLCNSNQVPSIANKKLTASKGSAYG